MKQLEFKYGLEWAKKQIGNSSSSTALTSQSGGALKTAIKRVTIAVKKLFGFPVSYGTAGWDSPVEWLIPDCVLRGNVGLLVGESQDLKTFIALHMAICIASGKEFCGHKVERGLVIYVAGESPGSIPRRLKAACDSFSVDVGEKVVVVNRPVSMLDESDINELKKLIRSESNRQGLRPAMLVLDTFSQCSAGIDENDAGDVASYLSTCTSLASTFGMAVLNVHHKNRNGKIRGSSALIGNVDFLLETNRVNDANRIATQMQLVKSKDSSTNVCLEFELCIQSLGFHDNLGREVSSLFVDSINNVVKTEKRSQAQIDGEKISDILVSVDEDWIGQDKIRQLFGAEFSDVQANVIQKRVSIACKTLVGQGVLQERKKGKTKEYMLVDSSIKQAA